MKKLMCTLLAIAMLCSFMVVNVSATNIYEGDGFKIITDYELTLYDTEDALGGIFYEYVYDAGDGEDDNGIAIGVFDYENDEAAELAEYVLESSDGVTFKGYPAVISEKYVSEHDIYRYTIESARNGVVSVIEVSAMGASNYQIMLEIVNSIEFTDEYSYADDEEDNDHASESSTYWENEYFTIDSDVELTLESDSYEDEECYYYSMYDDNGEWFGEIEVVIYSEDIDDLYNEALEYMNKDCTNVKEVKIGGLSGTQAEDNGERYLGRYIIISNENILYYIGIDGLVKYEAEFDILCDIVENDLHFKNAPAEDNKTEDKSDEDNKSDNEDNDKNGTEEKDNSVVIIAVAIIAGVVILGVTAMVIFGKKKKQ